MKILLVEDNRGDRDLLLEAFRISYPTDRITALEDGEEALVRLKKDWREFDLVILDLNLPKRDGLEILRTLRMECDIKTLPIVVLTTSRWQSDHDASELLMADASFVKPSLFSEYAQLVKSIRQVAEMSAYQKRNSKTK